MKVEENVFMMLVFLWENLETLAAVHLQRRQMKQIVKSQTDLVLRMMILWLA